MGDQSRGTIGGAGAINMPDVREAIKKIMEGGEVAFKLRREKYTGPVALRGCPTGQCPFPAS
jgi:hypothetical protein